MRKIDSTPENIELSIYQRLPALIGAMVQAKTLQIGLSKGMERLDVLPQNLWFVILERRAKPGVGQILVPKVSRNSKAENLSLRELSFNQDQDELNRIVQKLQKRDIVYLQQAFFTFELGESQEHQLKIEFGQIVPIIVAEKVWGGLLVGYEAKVDRDFQLGEKVLGALGEAFSIGIGHIINKTFLTGSRTTKPQKQRSRFINSDITFDLDPLFAEILEPQELFSHVYEQIRQLMYFDGLIGFQYFSDSDEIVFTFSQEKDELNQSNAEAFWAGEATMAFLQQIVHRKKTIWVQNGEADDSILEVIGSFDFKSVVGIPLIAHERAVGLMIVYAYEPSFFNKRQVEYFELMGQQLALSIASAQLYRFELNQRLRANILNDLSYRLLNVNSWTEIVEQAIQSMRTWYEHLNYCSISVKDRQSEALSEIGRWTNFPIKLEKIKERLLSSPIVFRVVDEGKPFVWHRHSRQREDEKFELEEGIGIESLLLIPLKASAHEPAIGYLAAGFSSSGPLPFEQNLQLGVAIASRLTHVINTIQLKHLEREQLKLSQTLQEMGAILTVDLSLDDFIDRMFDLLADVVEYDSVSMQLFDESTQLLRMVANRGFEDVGLVRQFMDELGQKAIERFDPDLKVLLIPDTLDSDTWEQADFNYSVLKNVRSYIGAKLEFKGRFLGIINVDSFTPNQFNVQTAKTVQAFANQAAVALEDNRLYKILNRRVTELSLINQIVAIISTLFDLDDVIRETTNALSQSLYRFNFGLMMVDEEQQKFLVNRHYHFSERMTYENTISVQEGIVGYVYREKKSIIVPDVTEISFFYAHESRTKSEIAVPILVEDRVVGVVNAESPLINAFSQDDQSFLETLAGQLAVAFQRIELYSEIERYATDLSEMVESRTRELNAEKDRIQAILQNADEGIIFTDATGTIEFINQATRRQTGYTVEECLGQQLSFFTSRYTSPIVTREILTAISEGRPWRGEVALSRKDQTVYDALVILSPIVDDAGEVVGYVVVQNDITKFKEVERLKSIFVTNVSHELRTPLTNIKTYVTLLERGREDRRERYFGVLNQELERLTTLIQDLLDVSKLDIDPSYASYQILDPLPFLNQIFLNIKTSMEGKYIFENNLPPELPTVWGDQKQLILAFSNLIKNSVSYSPEGSVVTLSGGVEGDELWISVEDEGAGISAEELPQIFDRFFRGSAAAAVRNAGTGLGLAISKEVVLLHRGRIEVKSEIGQGSVFTVWLPTIFQESA
ncbi:MAG: GAF domain-containing protein [Ardenticatenaceae bacterium]|nr:GAF domain-containing protein [Ardenticatenaceae bacterium]